VDFLVCLYSPSASSTHPTVPSPPQTMILTLGTSRNICRPGLGPPLARLKTCLGLSKYWHFLISLEPCLPPLLGLTKTNKGLTSSGGVIWKVPKTSIAAALSMRSNLFFSYIINEINDTLAHLFYLGHTSLSVQNGRADGGRRQDVHSVESQATLRVHAA